MYELEVLQHTARPVDSAYLIFFDEFAQSRLPLFFPRNRRIAVLKESPLDTKRFSPSLLSRRFDLVLTHRADLLELGQPFQRLDFSSNWLAKNIELENDSSKSKLVSFVANITHQSELLGYQLRKEAYERLRFDARIDFFGKGINEIRFKSEALDQYCFSVAMENTREDYYYSEKLIDCVMSETVPIYWGCPSIAEIFDPRGLLVFETLADLEKIVQTVSFSKYQAMRQYIEINKKICEEKLLSSFDGYMTRMVMEIERNFQYPKTRLFSAQVWKGIAAARLLLESIRQGKLGV